MNDKLVNSFILSFKNSLITVYPSVNEDFFQEISLQRAFFAYFCSHLTLLSLFQLANEVDVGFVKPAMSVGQVTIGGVYSGNNTFSGVYISCVQLHKSAIDKNFIKILELCPNRHGKSSSH